MAQIIDMRDLPIGTIISREGKGKYKILESPDNDGDYYVNTLEGCHYNYIYWRTATIWRSPSKILDKLLKVINHD